MAEARQSAVSSGTSRGVVPTIAAVAQFRFPQNES